MSIISLMVHGSLSQLNALELLAAAGEESGRQLVVIRVPFGVTEFIVDGQMVDLVSAAWAPPSTTIPELLFELLRCRAGTFEVSALQQHRVLTYPVGFGVIVAVLEQIATEWVDLADDIPSPDSVIALNPTLHRSTVILDENRWAIVRSIGNGSTLDRLIADTALSELTVRRLLAHCLVNTLVTVDGRTGRRSVKAAAAAGAVANPTPTQRDQTPSRDHWPAALPDGELAPLPAPSTRQRELQPAAIGIAG